MVLYSTKLSKLSLAAGQNFVSPNPVSKYMCAGNCGQTTYRTRANVDRGMLLQSAYLIKPQFSVHVARMYPCMYGTYQANTSHVPVWKTPSNTRPDIAGVNQKVSCTPGPYNSRPWNADPKAARTEHRVGVPGAFVPRAAQPKANGARPIVKGTILVEVTFQDNPCALD